MKTRWLLGRTLTKVKKNMSGQRKSTSHIWGVGKRHWRIYSGKIKAKTGFSKRFTEGKGISITNQQATGPKSHERRLKE